MDDSCRQPDTECCPPQSSSNPSKPKVPHPPSDPIGYKYKGEFKSMANYDKVYVVNEVISNLGNI